MQKNKGYFPVDQFFLDREFIGNPLMCCVKLARFKFVAKMLSETDVVLDLGCGNGYSSYFFSKFCKTVVGVDLYADFETRANRFAEHSKNLKFVQDDILRFHKRDSQQRYSAVTCIDVIEHFYLEDGMAIIENYAEILADGGVMIIGTPNALSGTYRSQKSKENHFHEYTAEEMFEICSRHFRRVNVFSMNDELVHTGFTKMAWFLFFVCYK